MNDFQKKGSYSYAFGRLEGIVKNYCIDLEHGGSPAEIAAKLRSHLNQIVIDLEGKEAA